MNRMYILLLLVAVFVIAACQEEKVPTYLDVDRINFVGTSEDDEDDPDYLYMEKNFLSEKGDVIEYVLTVKIQGRPSDVERSVFFTVQDSTVTGVTMELGECVVPAGKTRGSCQVRINRPAMGDKLISLVGIDYERSDFECGTFERQKFMFKISYEISYEILGISEGTWMFRKLNKSLGTWSFTKAAFICRTLGITNFSKWISESCSTDWGNDSSECRDKDILVQALEEYKANPANPPLYDETVLPEEKWISFDAE